MMPLSEWAYVHVSDRLMAYRNKNTQVAHSIMYIYELVVSPGFIQSQRFLFALLTS